MVSAPAAMPSPEPFSAKYMAVPPKTMNSMNSTAVVDSMMKSHPVLAVTHDRAVDATVERVAVERTPHRTNPRLSRAVMTNTALSVPKWTFRSSTPTPGIRAGWKPWGVGQLVDDPAGPAAGVLVGDLRFGLLSRRGCPSLLLGVGMRWGCSQRSSWAWHRVMYRVHKPRHPTDWLADSQVPPTAILTSVGFITLSEPGST